MNAKTALSIFAPSASSSSAAPKKRTSKEDQPINFKSTNESLVKRNLLYKQQLAQCTKTIEKLREENVALRQRNQELTDSSDEQKIELIVEQRVQSKLAHAAVLNKKLVNFLQQTGLELTGMFKEFEPEPTNLNSKRMRKPETNLDRLDESPMRNVPMGADDLENEQPNNVPTSSSVTSSSIQALENGTPRKANAGPRGRRSELFQDLTSVPVDDTLTEETLQAPAAVPRRAPLVIAPSATPAATKKREAPKSTARRQTPSVDRFKKPATPVAAARLDDSQITDTIQVRRQRSAKMNIKTMKEPSLGAKLRRPGKHDEPMPYIDTFF